MRSRKNAELGLDGMRMAAAIVAFLVPLVIYICTLARAVTFVDSGELSAVAATLGIAHPPGYPLFTLLGRLLSLIPVGTIPFRVGLVSALSAAGASSLIYWAGSALALQFYRYRLDPACLAGAAKAGRGPAASAGSTSESPGRRDLPGGIPAAAALIWAPLVGALLFSLSQTVWSQAVVVEVYCLQTFLVMLLVAACAGALARPASALVHWPWIALTCGLALTNHLTGILMVPALLLFLLLAFTARARQTDQIPVPFWQGVGAGVLPLLAYLYLPLRARTMPPVAWDYPETLHRFLVHVTARQYHAALGSKGLRIEELERFVTQQLPAEATWIFIVLAAVGLLALFWRIWRVGLLTLASAAIIILYNMAYPIHDIHLYYIPVLALVGLWAAAGCGVLVGLASRWHGVVGGAVGALLCLTCVVPFIGNWHGNDQRDFRLLDHYVRDTLTYLDQDAILFSGHWDRFSSPSLYVQQVEGYRKDVLVIDMGMLANPSLEKRLGQALPDLAVACREELRAVAEVARLAERGRPYDIAEGRARFQRLQRVLLERSLELRPTYVTSDMNRHPMLRGFHLVTEGLVARVAQDDEFRPFPVPDFRGPGISRAQARDRREQDVHFEYGRMLRNRARYLERHGRMAEAELMARRAEEVSR